MKNVKYLGFVGLGCALLLTGCGGSGNKLTCTIEQNGANLKTVYEFDSDGEKVTRSEMYLSVEIPDGASDEEIEQAKSMFEEEVCSDDSVEDCNASVKGNKLEVKATAKKEALENEGTKEEIKKQYEDQGYTCK